MALGRLRPKFVLSSFLPDSSVLQTPDGRKSEGEEEEEEERKMDRVENAGTGSRNGK